MDLYKPRDFHMDIKFSEDVVPLSDLKINPGKVVGRANDTHRPILLTSRGRGVAVVQALEDYEKNAEELRFVKAVARGLMDVREGDTVSVDEARKLLGVRK
jgi:prevent-host-death family protein